MLHRLYSIAILLILVPNVHEQKVRQQAHLILRDPCYVNIDSDTASIGGKNELVSQELNCQQ